MKDNNPHKKLEPYPEHVMNVINWAQAVLTAMNSGDVQKDSLLHKKLREVMIEYRNAEKKNSNKH